MPTTPLRLPILLAATLALVLAPVTRTAEAQGSADFRWQKQLAAGQRVSIRNVNGNISATPASGNRVEVIGRNRYSENAVRAEVIETSDGIVICALQDDMYCDEGGIRGRSRRNGNDWNRARMDFEVRLPRNLRLDVSSVSGDVKVEDVRNEVRASSVSGNVLVSGARSEVRGSSVSGDVRLQGLRVSRVSASTVSGRLEVAVDQLDGAEDLKFSSVSGDVVLTLPRSFGAELRLSTVSGEIDSSFQITLNGRMDRRRLEGRIGSGGRRLTVSTVSGDLRLREGQ